MALMTEVKENMLPIYFRYRNNPNLHMKIHEKSHAVSQVVQKKFYLFKVLNKV